MLSDVRLRPSVMARVALTDITLRKLTPPASGQIEVWDTKLPGFGVRITSKGTRSFVLVYRHLGRPRRLTIGRYPTLGLAQARELANDALVEVRRGNDPQGDRRQELEAATAKRSMIFSTILAEYVETHIKRRNKASTAKETERILRADFERCWAKIPIDEITRATVRTRLEEILGKGRPSAANHAFAAIRGFFNWCVREGHLEVSPCFGLNAPAKHVTRDRVLSDEELAQVWNGAAQVGWPFGAIVHLLILTGQRRGEVAAMRWQDFDFKLGLWSLPAELTKSNRAHTVPLTSRTSTLLLSHPRMHETWVFPARGDIDRPFRGFNKARNRLDERVAVRRWTLHDLRRTTATGLARLKVPPHIVEKLLNHSSGTLGGVAGVYNRFGYLDEMREALEMWELHLLETISPKPGSEIVDG